MNGEDGLAECQGLEKVTRNPCSTGDVRLVPGGGRGGACCRCVLVLASSTLLWRVGIRGKTTAGAINLQTPHSIYLAKGPCQNVSAYLLQIDGLVYEQYVYTLGIERAKKGHRMKLSGTRILLFFLSCLQVVLLLGSELSRGKAS